MRLYKTNRLDDPGVDILIEDLAEEFITTTKYQEWLEHGGRLFRHVTAWLLETHGSPDVDDADLLDDLVHIIIIEKGRHT